MVNWSAAMEQTFEYYVVDPGTWRDARRLDNVKSCSITRDSESATLGSASIDIAESLGECYVRIYLVTIQNGITEKHPLGTFLVQTPAFTFDGRYKLVSMDTYTPLLELKESPPPIGYFIHKDQNIMEWAHRLVREHARAPVVKTICDTNLQYDFVADADDTWLTYISDLIASAKYKFSLDEMGRILFAPEQDTASLRPIWTYTDDNSSILYPEATLDRDLFNVPNVVEVLYSGPNGHYYARAVNEDSNSPISTVNRGREIGRRVTDPSIAGNPSKGEIEVYANTLLREMSVLEYTVSYTHGYCPVRLGDCVRLNYSRAGITDVKARVISQTIHCDTGCRVSEKAVFTTKLWR